VKVFVLLVLFAVLVLTGCANEPPTADPLSEAAACADARYRETQGYRPRVDGRATAIWEDYYAECKAATESPR